MTSNEHEIPTREFQDRGVHKLLEVKKMGMTGAEFLLQQERSEILLTQTEDKFGKLPMEVVTD